VSEFVDVAGVRVLGGYVLELTWADGAVTTIDVEPYLWGPALAPLRNPALFAGVSVDPDLGTVVWPNGADISPRGAAPEITAGDDRARGDEPARRRQDVGPTGPAHR